MDERLAQIESEKQKALNENKNTYDSMLQDNQNLFNQQNEYANTYEQAKNEAVDKQLAYQETLINQQKESARKNMETESKKAKNEYTAYVNPYGNQAESFASQGLLNSGVSETAKLGGWNTYQNRIATANKTMQDALTEYDNAMNEARLTYDVQKAENALAKLEMQLNFAESFYNNKATISQNQLTNNQNIDSEYYNRYQTEYNNIQNEKAQEEAIRQFNAQLAEEQRQYNESMAYQKEQDALDQANWEKEYALAQSSKKSNSSNTNNNKNNYDLTGNNGTLSANGKNIINNPYTNSINPDTQYGVFDTGNGSGYQPNNVGGVKLSKSGMTVSEFFDSTGNVGSTGVNIDNQSVWSANGKYYVWDGSQNKYIDVTSYANTKNKGKSAFGTANGGGFR